MSDETKMEVIKALAYGESVEMVAEFADVSEEEIRKIAEECAAEIEDRRKEAEGYAVDE